MPRSKIMLPRRKFLGSLAASLTAIPMTTCFAEQLMRTPPQTEGPFYPDKLPLDTDNDLLIVNDTLTSAVGEIAHLAGRILDANGQPVRNAIVEIWQVDHHGVYLHSGSSNSEKRDRHFQGFGRFLTGSKGEYYFRTVKPVPYPGRTPHIHVRVNTPSKNGPERFTTQCYLAGHPQNEKDGIFMSVKNDAARKSLLVDFQPVPQSKAGEVAGKFDIVLGFTPAG